MPNSDNTWGTYNKTTKIFNQWGSQNEDSSWNFGTSHANVDAAKSWFLTAEALAVYDECCTELQWALVADTNGGNTMLKATYTFGTKGAGTAAADDWAEQFKSRKSALVASNGFFNNCDHVTDSTDHLF
jgi:hypothetical protein